MDKKTQFGSLAEVKAIAYFIEHGWHVFDQVTGKAPLDLVVLTDEGLCGVQVKSTTHQFPSGKYKVELRSIRSNKSSNTIHKFDATYCKWLVVYIQPEDRLVILDAKPLHGRSSVSVQ